MKSRTVSTISVVWLVVSQYSRTSTNSLNIRSESAARMDKEGGHKTDGGPKHPVDQKGASRIQSSEAKQHEIKKGSTCKLTKFLAALSFPLM